MAGRGRGGSGDPDFGSDSFLDIIANLVGILIILIVLAGLRASQAPLQPEELPGMADADATGQPASPQPRSQPADSGPADSGPVGSGPAGAADREPVAPPEPNPVPPLLAADPQAEVRSSLEPLREALAGSAAAAQPQSSAGMTTEEAAKLLATLQQQVQQEETRLAELNVAAAWDETRALQRRLADRRARLRTLQDDAAQQTVLAERDARRVRQAAAKALRLRQRLDDVNQQLEELSQSDAPNDPLEIRINPIGRRSTGDELFFVIENEQVLRIPVRELFELAAGRERRNTSLILRAETQRGVVGPVEGVTYDYEVGMRIRPVSSSSGGVRYANSLVMQGIMHPGPNAPREPVDDALAEGGILNRTLLHAARGAVVRLSVATDSFAHARRVAAWCRDLGYLVSMNAMAPGEEIRVRFGAGSDAVAQ